MTTGGRKDTSISEAKKGAVTFEHKRKVPINPILHHKDITNSYIFSSKRIIFSLIQLVACQLFSFIV